MLIGAQTRQLVRDAVQVEPVAVEAKGKAQVDAFRLVDVDLAGGVDRAPARHAADRPRAPSSSSSQQAFERTVREQRCHLFTRARRRRRRQVAARRRVPRRHRRARRRAARASTTARESRSGRSSRSSKQLGPRADRDYRADRRKAARRPNELFWAVRAQLEEVAAEQPLVVFFDDIQWGEPTFLDLVDHIADLSRGAPILVLCLARPELLDKRPGWGGGKLNATTILLEPLSADECDELIERARRRRADEERADPRGGGREPALRRGDAGARRRRTATCASRRPSRRCSGAPRPARPRGAHGDRARRRRGRDLPPRRRRRARRRRDGRRAAARRRSSARS